MALLELITPVDKKLGAAETLEKATEALSAHRAWIKRRANQNSVSPAIDLEHGTSPISKPASWAIGTGPIQPGK